MPLVSVEIGDCSSSSFLHSLSYTPEDFDWMMDRCQEADIYFHISFHIEKVRHSISGTSQTWVVSDYDVYDCEEQECKVDFFLFCLFPENCLCGLWL